MAEELETVTAERDALLRELEALEDQEEKVECPGPVCAYSFVGEERAQQLVDHYVRDHANPLLLWLHAEAVWERHQANLEIERVDGAWREVVGMWEQGHQNDVLPYTAKLEDAIAALNVAVAEERASRQAWAEEAMRQSSELKDYADLLETCAESPSPEHLAKMLRRMATRRPELCEFVSDSGDGCEETEGHGTPHLRWFDEIRYEEIGQRSAVCACPPVDAVFPAPWTPPQCAVHPESGLANNPEFMSAQDRISGAWVPSPPLGELIDSEPFGSSSVLPDGEAQ